MAWAVCCRRQLVTACHPLHSSHGPWLATRRPLRFRGETHRPYACKRSRVVLPMGWWVCGAGLAAGWRRRRLTCRMPLGGAMCTTCMQPQRRGDRAQSYTSESDNFWRTLSGSRPLQRVTWELSRGELTWYSTLGRPCPDRPKPNLVTREVYLCSPVRLELAYRASEPFSPVPSLLP